MRQTFPKLARLLSKKDFSTVRKQGQRFWGHSMLVDVQKNPKRPSRLGLSVSKRYGKAVHRNLFKRHIRELFRKHQDKMPTGTQMHVSPVYKQGLHTFVSLYKDFISLLSKKL